MSKIICRHCGGKDHSSMTCWQRPRSGFTSKRKSLRWRSKKAEIKYGELHKAWHKMNRPNKDKGWTCWLQISPSCPKQLTYAKLQLEHVYPRAKFKELEYVVMNVKPACESCNKAKLSNTPQQLAMYYENIALKIQTPAWKRWEQQVIPFSPRLSLYLGYTDTV